MQLHQNQTPQSANIGNLLTSNGLLYYPVPVTPNLTLDLNTPNAYSWGWVTPSMLKAGLIVSENKVYLSNSK
jgi:hypothetical protein